MKPAHERAVRHPFAGPRAASLIAGLCMFAPGGGVAQKPAPNASVDPFVAAIEIVKRSVVSLDCLEDSGSEAKILERVGTAFLVGDRFLTAAHVVADLQTRELLCPVSAITFPVGDWRPESRKEPMVWFPFRPQGCRVDTALDIAVCTPGVDLPGRIRNLNLKAASVQFEWNTPLDGTQVAFTGFPLRARDLMTFRAHVAAFRTPWPDEPIPELVLDRPTLAGFSGSPVYLANGKVVAIILKDGKDDATGVTIVRPVSVLREMLRERLERK